MHDIGRDRRAPGHPPVREPVEPVEPRRLATELEAIAGELGDVHALVLELRDRARVLGETIDAIALLAAQARRVAELRAERDPLEQRLLDELLP